MRSMICISLFFFVPWCEANAADIPESIIQSGEYYYGTGTSKDENEASDTALNELLNSISVTISSSFEGKLTEVNRKVDQSAKLVVKSHSRATLNNVQTIKQIVSKKIQVFHYIKKSDVSKIFEERKRLVYEIYTNANEMEDEGNIGYALKLYYFAAILLNSVPDRTVSYEGKNITTELPHRINDILLNTEFACREIHSVSEKEKMVTLVVTYKGKPVSYLEFTFWDGAGQVNVVARNGEAMIQLMSGSVNFTKLDIDIKYSFYECRDEIREVSELWQVVNRPTFKNSKQIPLKPISPAKAPAPSPSNTQPPVSEKQIKKIIDGLSLALLNPGNCPVAGQIQDETVAFIENMKTYTVAPYSADPFLSEKLRRFFEYNHPMLAEFTVNADINKTATGWEVRKIGVLNRYPTIRKQAFDNIILDFNESGKLQDVNFATMDELYKKFVDQAEYGKDWGNRQIIIKFIERYRTAYLNRDLATIKQIFSDNAVIIVGREVKTKPGQVDMQFRRMNDAQPKYESLRFSKDQYLKRQKSIFDSQRDIFLGFSSFKIMRHGEMEGVYGVSMRQHYQSTGYSDEGHLFLYIDFKGTEPLIYVRAWQPQEWDQSAIVNMSNFQLFK